VVRKVVRAGTAAVPRLVRVEKALPHEDDIRQLYLSVLRRAVQRLQPDDRASSLLGRMVASALSPSPSQFLVRRPS
jgi:hypothetical protein